MDGWMDGWIDDHLRHLLHWDVSSLYLGLLKPFWVCCEPLWQPGPRRATNQPVSYNWRPQQRRCGSSGSSNHTPVGWQTLSTWPQCGKQCKEAWSPSCPTRCGQCQWRAGRRGKATSWLQTPRPATDTVRCYICTHHASVLVKLQLKPGLHSGLVLCLYYWQL